MWVRVPSPAPSSGRQGDKNQKKRNTTGDILITAWNHQNYGCQMTENTLLANAKWLQSHLNHLHDVEGCTWLKLEEMFNIPCSTLWDTAKKGKMIPRKHWAKLGWDFPVVTVVVVEGDIPDGALSLGAKWCVICGKPFVPNHPIRIKCFVCSPKKSKKRGK